MTSTSTDRRKVLIPLATLLAAGAVVVGSGATFTSTSNHAVAVTSGTLRHTNDSNAVTLRAENLKPGDTATGTVTITNAGTLDSTLTLRETSDSSTFLPGDLLLEIKKGTTLVWGGSFGTLDSTTKLDLGALPVGASTTVTYTVSMPASAGNENQGKSASAGYEWVTTQTAGQDTSFLRLP